jgi:hypothetical protein
LTDLWAEVDGRRRLRVAPLGDGGRPAAEQVDGLAHGLERRRRVHLAAGVPPHCRRRRRKVRLLAAPCWDAADGALRRHFRHRGRVSEERSTARPQR